MLGGRLKLSLPGFRRTAVSEAAPVDAPPPAPTGSASDADLRAIRAQIDQARSLLTDAIGKLGHSFDSLEKDTTGQKKVMETLLTKLAGTGIDEVDELGRREVSIQQFAKETSAVLHQFTDLLSSVSTQSIKTVYRIDDMAKQLEEVFKFVADIDEIAEETFTLAVNATIEAAHAGHAGRSFSVIAGNVRELSKKTRRFNDLIGSQVNKAQSTVNEVRQIISEMASRDLNVALTGKERVQSMVEDLERFQRFISTSVDDAKDATDRIAGATSEAVVALQFEDILNQLLASMARRIDRMTDTRAVGTGASAPAAPDFSSEPVRQHDLKAGEVEMF